MHGGGKTNRKYDSFPSMKRKQIFAYDNRVILLLNINKQACIKIVPCFQSKMYGVPNNYISASCSYKHTSCLCQISKSNCMYQHIGKMSNLEFFSQFSPSGKLALVDRQMDAFKQQIPVHCSWRVLVPLKIHLALQSLI